MEIAELVLKYIQALSWPIVVLVLIWCLRRHLAGAIARLSRVDTPAGSLEFANAAMAAREISEELESSALSDSVERAASPAADSATSAASEGEVATPHRADGDESQQPLPTAAETRLASLEDQVRFAETIAHRSPTFAIQHAWDSLDEAQSIVSEMRHSDYYLRHPDFMALMTMLEVLHAEVIGGGAVPTASSAGNYVQSCERAITSLRRFARHLSEGP